MKYLVPTLIMTLATVCTMGHAQERTAGGEIQTQLTWSSLNGQLSAINNLVSAVDSRIVQAELCGKKGQVYAPDAPGRDMDGCRMAEKDPSVTTVTTPDVATMTAIVDSIIACSAGTKFYTRSSGCIAAAYAPATSYRWVAAGTGSAGQTPCTAGVGSSCSSKGAVCRTTTTTSQTCSDNQCSGMGYRLVTSYSAFVCN